ncbi:DNA cytosine methyltransferase [Rhizobium sp. C1]|uniref:DNA cytosine methyltransferase n=1 Tax=Rhizobium sp. C1 TaxID=1349799 RepID=UPI001E2BD1B6|nr:DNA cytosine methyltransferase [Rhizobium sp. C1]MCD2178227.1 DNA cytosine methyltransferase [Rhizobium sp. C1]
MPASFVSLYSGCGGLDLGFRDAGFRCAAAFDHDKYAVATHKQNFGGEAHCVDLSVPPSETIELIRCNDILIAGPPCQGFSTAGNNNPSDKRNNHLINVAQLASRAKPRIVVIENVRGLLSKHNSQHFENVTQTLAGSGYHVSWKLLSASEYGIPQKRIRIVIVASLDEPFRFELQSCAPRNLRDALHGVDEVPDHRESFLREDSDGYRIATRIKSGQKLSNVRKGDAAVHTWDIPEVFGEVSPEEATFLNLIVRLRRQQRRRKNGDADPVPLTELTAAAGPGAPNLIHNLEEKGYLKHLGEFIDLRNTFNGKYRRLSWENPSPTVDTRFGQPRYFLHPDKHRGFSAREAARIQTFPDKFSFVGSETAVFRMIGNAVPPMFGRAIASAIRDQWGLA